MCRTITNCVGYIWWSDKAEPEIVQNKSVVLKNEEIPFIIEGQLFDDKSKTSYSIKYVDGEYKLKPYVVADEDFNKSNVVLRKYQSHRMGGKILQFLEYWKAEKDELCLDMEVLKPTEVVFVGFKEN